MAKSLAGFFLRRAFGKQPRNPWNRGCQFFRKAPGDQPPRGRKMAVQTMTTTQARAFQTMLILV